MSHRSRRVTFNFRFCWRTLLIFLGLVFLFWAWPKVW